jgi:hypothetical protein
MAKDAGVLDILNEIRGQEPRKEKQKRAEKDRESRQRRYTVLGLIPVAQMNPHELSEFNGPDFDEYDESASYSRGQILVVYKIQNDPTTSYLENCHGWRVSMDQSIHME